MCVVSLSLIIIVIKKIKAFVAMTNWLPDIDFNL